VFLICFLIDKFGTYMYNRGIAKPFYVYGRRVHHKIIYIASPTYALGLYLARTHQITVILPQLWMRLSVLGLIVVCCLAVDLAADSIRKSRLFNHEWLYLSIPLYVFAFVIHV
jgi:hypothetical protein